MRDIHKDLSERVQVVTTQMKGVHGLFEEQVEQLKRHRDGRLAALKSELDVLHRVMQIEHRSNRPTPQQNAVLTGLSKPRRAP